MGAVYKLNFHYLDTVEDEKNDSKNKSSKVRCVVYNKKREVHLTVRDSYLTFKMVKKIISTPCIDNPVSTYIYQKMYFYCYFDRSLVGQ